MAAQLLQVKRVYVERLTGGETAAQMRDLLITGLQGSKLFFVLTENLGSGRRFPAASLPRIWSTPIIFNTSWTAPISGGYRKYFVAIQRLSARGQ